MEREDQNYVDGVSHGFIGGIVASALLATVTIAPQLVDNAVNNFSIPKTPAIKQALKSGVSTEQLKAAFSEASPEISNKAIQKKQEICSKTPAEIKQVLAAERIGFCPPPNAPSP